MWNIMRSQLGGVLNSFIFPAGIGQDEVLDVDNLMITYFRKVKTAAWKSSEIFCSRLLRAGEFLRLISGHLKKSICTWPVNSNGGQLLHDVATWTNYLLLVSFALDWRSQGYTIQYIRNWNISLVCSSPQHCQPKHIYDIRDIWKHCCGPACVTPPLMSIRSAQIIHTKRAALLQFLLDTKRPGLAGRHGQAIHQTTTRIGRSPWPSWFPYPCGNIESTAESNKLLSRGMLQSFFNQFKVCGAFLQRANEWSLRLKPSVARCEHTQHVQ